MVDVVITEVSHCLLGMQQLFSPFIYLLNLVYLLHFHILEDVENALNQAVKTG